MKKASKKKKKSAKAIDALFVDIFIRKTRTRNIVDVVIAVVVVAIVIVSQPSRTSYQPATYTHTNT